MSHYCSFHFMKMTNHVPSLNLHTCFFRDSMYISTTRQMVLMLSPVWRILLIFRGSTMFCHEICFFFKPIAEFRSNLCFCFHPFLGYIFIPHGYTAPLLHCRLMAVGPLFHCFIALDSICPTFLPHFQGENHEIFHLCGFCQQTTLPMHDQKKIRFKFKFEFTVGKQMSSR